jgi:hypothetical protein
MEMDGDLFSGLEEPEAKQPETTPYDKIIESRKSASFAAEQIERQDEVQVVYHAHPIEEVKAAAKEYFHGDALAGDVWANKYALKDSDGNTYELTPDDMHHRIAREIARIERRYPNPMTEEEIYEVLKDFEADRRISLYTDFNCGSYAEWRGYRCYADPRAEVFLKSINGKEDILAEVWDSMHMGITVKKLTFESPSFLSRMYRSRVVLL